MCMAPGWQCELCWLAAHQWCNRLLFMLELLAHVNIDSSKTCVKVKVLQGRHRPHFAILTDVEHA